MLNSINEMLKTKYNLKTELGIDLKIYSNNTDEVILVTTLEDKILIKYEDSLIESDYKNAIRDITYLLNSLTYIYYLDINNDILHKGIYLSDKDHSLIEEVEDFVWNNKKEYNIEKILVVMFALDYSFLAHVSGSFIDTFWQIYDKAHYEVLNTALKKFKYRKDFDIYNSALLTSVIKSDINLIALKKYFLKYGYAFLIDYNDQKSDVYELIDIDFSNCKTIAGDSYLIMSADYKSILYVKNDKYYIMGLVCDEYQTIYKYIQIEDEVCNYIHNIKTSRVLYKDHMYEAYGNDLSEELNNLNKLLDYKINSCFFCKYGNYLYDPDKIYCLKGFKYNNLTDIAYIIEETKLIPFDHFNLCDDYKPILKKDYIHTKCNYKI